MPRKNTRPLEKPPFSGVPTVGFGSYSRYCMVLAIRGLRQLRYSAQFRYCAAVLGETQRFEQFGGQVT